MKKLSLLILSILFTSAVFAQDLYLKTFGNAKDAAVIFLHGGPGYNAATFEATTAQKLADAGQFVVIYDRRGEGRSDAKATFTFEESIDDLYAIYKQFNLKKATLIGHSFGGMLGTFFAEKHPEKVTSLILVGAPLNLQESFKTIIKSSKNLYEANQDSVNLNYIGMLEKMDTTALMYGSYCFMHAMQNGFYSTDNPTEEAKAITNDLKQNELAKYANQMTPAPPSGFWKNEQYTTLDVSVNLTKLKLSGLPIYAMYGKEDGLYSEAQIKNLANIIGNENVLYLENCSHSVFIDQQSTFIESIQKWNK